MGVKRHPPAFIRFDTFGSRQHNGRLAGGSLRCLLTATADELVGRSLAASPGNRRLGHRQVGGARPDRTHGLMENHHGLFIDARLTLATGTAEREAAIDMIAAWKAGIGSP